VKHSGKGYPIELADWDAIIREIKIKIDKVRPMARGQKRKAKIEFYSDAGDHCLFMKDIFRNNVSHTRKPYTQSETLAAFDRVRDFMKFLAVTIYADSKFS
jgi:hypothetical protein